MGRKLALTFALTVTFTLAISQAYAQEPEGRSAEGGPSFPAPDEPEHKADGIENWWSWDYGPGAKDPAHKHLPPPFGFALINFAIFAAIMYKLASKPLKNFVKDRHDHIRKDLDEAAKLRAAAETQLREYEKRVKNVDQEIETLLAQIKQEAEADKARIIAAAEDQAKRLKADAERQIAAEIARARQELQREVVEVAVKAADGILKQQIGADDQRKMAEKYVTTLEQTAPKAGRPA
jgi:F-type H+-transporting ATPase subunit b